MRYNVFAVNQNVLLSDFSPRTGWCHNNKCQFRFCNLHTNHMHSCLSRYPFIIKFSQSVSQSVSVCLCLCLSLSACLPACLCLSPFILPSLPLSLSLSLSDRVPKQGFVPRPLSLRKIFQTVQKVCSPLSFQTFGYARNNNKYTFFYRTPLCQEAANIVSSGKCSNLGDTMYECYQVFGDMAYGFGYGYTDCIRRKVYPNGDRFKVRPSCPRCPRSLHLFH